MFSVFVVCVKEFRSAVRPDANYGELGKRYRVVNQHPPLTTTPEYLSLEGIDPLPGGGFGWVNAERFKREEI